VCAISSLTSTFAISSPDEFLYCIVIQAIWCSEFWKMTKSGWQFALASFHSKFWRTRPPYPFVIYAHGMHEPAAFIRDLLAPGESLCCIINGSQQHDATRSSLAHWSAVPRMDGDLSRMQLQQLGSDLRLASDSSFKTCVHLCALRLERPIESMSNLSRRRTELITNSDSSLSRFLGLFRRTALQKISGCNREQRKRYVVSAGRTAHACIEFLWVCAH